jgi:hypothetical protein
LCRDETRTSEHIGNSPAEEGWTVANDNEMYLVAALTCNVLQQAGLLGRSLEPDIQEGIGHTAKKKQIDLYRAMKSIGHGRHAEGEHKAGKAVPGTHGV